MAANITVKFPKYSGQSCPKSFLRRFTIHARAYDLPKARWGDWLATTLTGLADSFLEVWIADSKKIEQILQLDPIDFNELALALMLAFSSFQDYHFLEADCDKYRMVENQSAESYYYGLRVRLIRQEPPLPIAQQMRIIIKQALPAYIPHLNIASYNYPSEILHKLRQLQQTEHLLTGSAIGTNQTETTADLPVKPGAPDAPIQSPEQIDLLPVSTSINSDQSNVGQAQRPLNHRQRRLRQFKNLRRLKRL